MAKSVEILQDIIDSVIEAVGDDKGSLKQCTLVSSSFLLPSRKQLFFSITIRCEETCQGIHQFLVQNPIIQFSVRAITLKDKFSMWGNESCEWMNGTSLLAILQFPFCCLEHLLIQREKDWDWNSFSSELKDAVSNIIHSSPGLKHLSLKGITNLPSTFFTHIVHLEILELYLLLDDFGDENSSLLTRAASNEVTPMASHTVPVIDTCLWYLNKRLDQDFSTRFASSAYSSLIQDTGIKGRTKSKFLPFICGLRNFQTLFRLRCGTRGDFDLLPVYLLFGSLLMSLTSPATLERLVFVMKFSDDYTESGSGRFIENLRDADVWSRLDSIATHPACSRLRQVLIFIDYSVPRKDYRKELDENLVLKVVLDDLPSLRTKGILFVNFRFISKSERSIIASSRFGLAPPYRIYY